MLKMLGISKLGFQEAALAMNRLCHLKNSRCVMENVSNCYDFANFLPLSLLSFLIFLPDFFAEQQSILFRFQLNLCFP